MRREDVRAFVDRRWDLVRDEKLAEDARFYRKYGARGCLRVAGELYAHAERVAPRPVTDDRAKLAERVAWRALLDRVDRDRARR